MRTIERRISELQKLGFIVCSGRGYNRRISLGLIFNNSATLAVNNEKLLNNSAKYANTTAKIDDYNRHGGGDSKHYTNQSSKEIFSFSLPFNPKYQEYVGRIKADKDLGLIAKDEKWMSQSEWEAGEKKAL